MKKILALLVFIGISSSAFAMNDKQKQEFTKICVAGAGGEQLEAIAKQSPNDANKLMAKIPRLMCECMSNKIDKEFTAQEQLVINDNDADVKIPKAKERIEKIGLVCQADVDVIIAKDMAQLSAK